MSGEEPKTGQTLSVLAHYGFIDLAIAADNLEQLSAKSKFQQTHLLENLGKTANPDQALTYLLRINEIQPLQTLSEPALARLALVVGASEALAEFLLRTPEALELFESEPSSSQQFDLVANPSWETTDTSFSRAVTELRRNYRKALLQIAIWDLSRSDAAESVQAVAASLAKLAAAALDGGLKLARLQLLHNKSLGEYQHQEIDATKLAIIGMGKGGAGELNYISDVDVIFVAEGAGLDTERMLEIATKLATRTMRIMDETNIEPGLWQVDANLRPEGKAGALVRTLDSHLAYYARWAENWEFQALIKANPIAGDIELGNAYRDSLQSLIWQSSKRENFVESVQAMRERVTANISSEELDRQIKLGVGGLRDIEFTVQLLQLVHGRDDGSVHAPDTLTAIKQLSTAGYIGRQEAEEFSNHYKFLRLLEHRIQLTQLRRTHLMPDVELKQRAIARAINKDWSAKDLLEHWQKVKSAVRSLHQKIFYRPLLVAVSKSDGGLVLSSEQVLDRLSAIGFLDPKGAATHIEALTSGLARRAQIQRQLLPVLLEWFGNGTDPDSALLAFRRLSENLGESHWYLRMLRDASGAAERLTYALSTSKLATSLLELIPEGAAWLEDPKLLSPISLEALSQESDSIAERYEDLEDFAKAVRHIRRRETLRLGLGWLVGEQTLARISNGLTNLNDWYLVSLTKEILRQKAPGLDLGIVAMGRFGGSELVFGSDADVMFVYGEQAKGESSQKDAELVIDSLRTLAKDPQLEFELDLDLRPEGKNGPIARSIDSYAAYYSRWGDVWENQALLRARMMFGSDKLVQAFSTLVDEYRYPKELPSSSIIEIRRIKARVESERLPQGADPKRHLKLGRGSLSDIEWLVQLLQLQFGNLYPKVRTPKTLEGLESLVKHGILEAHDARVLLESWNLCSSVRSAIVLATGRKSDMLPIDRKQLESISRILKYPRNSATALEEDYLAKTRRARMVFERVFFA